MSREFMSRAEYDARVDQIHAEYRDIAEHIYAPTDIRTDIPAGVRTITAKL